MHTYISKFNAYLEEIDPFYIQRILFRKGLYIGILFTLAYIIFMPKLLTALLMALIWGYAIFENIGYKTYKKKYKALLFYWISAILFAVFFTLLSRHKLILYVSSLICFFTFVFFTIKFLPAYKGSVIHFYRVAISAVVITGSELAAKEVAFGMSLVLIIIIFAYKTHDNLYQHVWYRAFKKSCLKIQKNLAAILEKNTVKFDSKAMNPINMMFDYKRLYKKENLFNIIRISRSVRNLNMMVIYLRNVDLHETFWQHFFEVLNHFNEQIRIKKSFTLEVLEQLKPEKAISHQCLAFGQLKIIVENWNKVCTQD
ncbi:hypothetical protein OAO18_02575 [Francisellaceae bacterium]|nr:hypothetical protein [Francisellaceae bacterium]